MRLELSTRTDIALRALRHLDQVRSRVSRSDLSDHLSTTPDFLAQVMGPLVRSGWVGSKPGRLGGYTISPDARRASVLDVVRSQEEVPGDGRCVLRAGPCDSKEKCALHDPWSKARDAMLAELSLAPALQSHEGGSSWTQHDPDPGTPI